MDGGNVCRLIFFQTEKLVVLDIVFAYIHNQLPVINLHSIINKIKVEPKRETGLIMSILEVSAVLALWPDS